jgi:predicted phosphohydrolase
MFTVFHISDLHFGADPSGVDSPIEQLEKKIKGLEGHDIGIWTAFKDHLLSRIKQTESDYRICVTGDISRFGRIESFEVAKELFFDESKTDLSKFFGLKLNSDKFIIVPGNHDSYDHSISKKNNLMAFNWQFHPSVREYPIKQNVNINNINYLFFTLDSTYKKNGGNLVKKLGKGFVNQIQFDRIRTYLSDYKNAKTVKILLMHHSPILSDSRHSRTLMLDQSQVTLEEIAKNNINIVLCGHLHDDFYDVLPLKSLIKHLPKKRGLGRLLRSFFKETHLNDYHIISINGKKARYFDSIAYHYIKTKQTILDHSKSNFRNLEQFESYLHSLPEYEEFLQNFQLFTETKTGIIMAGSLCKRNEKDNSYLELIFDDDLNKIIVKRHKYNKKSHQFDTRERVKELK